MELFIPWRGIRGGIRKSPRWISHWLFHFLFNQLVDKSLPVALSPFLFVPVSLTSELLISIHIRFSHSWMHFGNLKEGVLDLSTLQLVLQLVVDSYSNYSELGFFKFGFGSDSDRKKRIQI